MKLTSIPLMRFGLYQIIRHRPLQPKGSYLPLYKSRVFSGDNLTEILKKKQPEQRYKQYLPILLIAGIDFVKPRVLVIELQFNPETEIMRVISLRTRGIITQQFHIDNLRPQIFADVLRTHIVVQPILPIFMDDTMTYYNKFTDENYLFESDGIWNEQTINHEKLSLETRLNQKQWFDRCSIR